MELKETLNRDEQMNIKPTERKKKRNNEET